MPKICYQPKNFRLASLARIDQANEIIDDYLAQGYKLTLRQLYYQFVSRDWIPNTQKSYSNLGNLINDARLAGMIDWNAIEDRTRNLHKLSTWDNPSDMVESAAYSYRTDKWATQAKRIEVWIEKEALSGVFQRVCDELEIPFFACRGYTSQSEMWGAAQRLIKWSDDHCQDTIILHFGDHDPSGIDMTDDIRRRMEMFDCEVEVRRMALNMDQIDHYDPPPNPAKATDARFASYQRQFGNESWELDALDPSVLSSLVRDEVLSLRDTVDWAVQKSKQEREREEIQTAANGWDTVVDLMRKNKML